MRGIVKIDRLELERIYRSIGAATDADFASLLGLSRAFVSQVHSGSRGPSIMYVSRMWTELGIPFRPGTPGSPYKFSDEETKRIRVRDAS